MYSFDNNQQALHGRPAAMEASSWSAKAFLFQVAHLVSCSKQYVIWSHESGQLVSVDWLKVVAVHEGILLQLGQLRKKACQYFPAQLKFRAGYVDFIF